jgi:hypothetical protein
MFIAVLHRIEIFRPVCIFRLYFLDIRNPVDTHAGDVPVFFIICKKIIIAVAPHQMNGFYDFGITRPGRQPFVHAVTAIGNLRAVPVIDNPVQSLDIHEKQRIFIPRFPRRVKIAGVRKRLRSEPQEFSYNIRNIFFAEIAVSFDCIL